MQNWYLITCYNAATSGSIVNQVQRAFNGLGQMTTEWQAHGGAVNTSTSPKVQYAWSEMASGVNHSRLTNMTYPSGYVLTFNYSSGLNGDISRLSSLSDSSGTVESYDYLGYGSVVRRGHSQPGVDLTFIKQSGESNGDAGDQYAGLDRFGRVVDQRWIKTSGPTTTDRFQYGYDRNSNRLWRDNLVNAAFGELYGYDNLNQVASFDRGTLNGTKTGLTGSASRSQDWDYDALGNWDSVITDASTQTRTANAQNEITAISGVTTPTYDANGNMTGDETGKQFVYDAWNRLVTVKTAGGTTLKTYTYDVLNRRVSETASGTTTDLFYSSQWQVLEEKVGNNTTARYVWSPVYVDAMILRDRDTNADGTLDERLWVQQDANWNVTALVDGTGAVVERYAYDPFGVVTIYDASYTVRASSSYAWTQGFQGMFFDSVSGLNVSRGRSGYSPTLGRWVSLDPIRFEGGAANLYGFVGNGPTVRADPSGLYEIDIVFNEIFTPGSGIYHAFILVTDVDGSRYYFRAGPYKSPFGWLGSVSPSVATPDEGNKDFAKGPWGILYPQYGVFLPDVAKIKPFPAVLGVAATVCVGTKDFRINNNVQVGPVVLNKQVPVNLISKPKVPAKQVIDQLKKISDDVKNQKIPYDPDDGPNSNSFAHHLVIALIGRPIDPPLGIGEKGVPGWKVSLTPPKKP